MSSSGNSAATVESGQEASPASSRSWFRAFVLMLREMTGGIAIVGVLLMAPHLPGTIIGLWVKWGWTYGLGFASWLACVVLAGLFSIYGWGLPTKGKVDGR